MSFNDSPADPSSFDNSSTNTNTTVVVRLWSMLPPDERYERLVAVTVFITLGSLGIILNTLPILLTLCTADIRKNNVNLLIANLSTADLLCSACFVFGQPFFTLYHERMSPVGCQWLGFINFVAAFYEFICPPFVAVNRYISLYYPHHLYERIYTVRNIVCMCLGTWIFCIIIPLIFMLNGQAGFDEDNKHCCIVVKNSHVGWTVTYWMIIIFPLVAGCDGTMLFCNYKIYKKLSEHASGEMLKNNNVVRQNREILYFLLADMTFPIIFHTTYHVSKFALIDRTGAAQKVSFIFLYILNSIVRGTVTLTMLRPYREGVKKLVRTLLCRTDNQVGVSGTGSGVGKSSRNT